MAWRTYMEGLRNKLEYTEQMQRLWDKLFRSVKHLGVTYGDELDPQPAPDKTVYDRLREEDLL